MDRKILLVMVVMVSWSLMVGGCGKKEKEGSTDQEQVKKVEDAVQNEDAKAVGEKVKEALKAPAVKEPAKVPAVKEPVKAPAVKEPAKAPAAAKTVKGPWADAKVGTMTKIKGMGGMFSVSEVIKVDPKSVTVKMTFLGADGKAMSGVQPQEMVYQREYIVDPQKTKSTAEMKRKKVGEKTMTVAGKSLKCTIFETVTELSGKKITTRSYTCQDVPGGVVLVESDAMGKMQVMSELVDFKK